MDSHGRHHLATADGASSTRRSISDTASAHSEIVDVEFPSRLPLLTPGLARALVRVIVHGAQHKRLLEIHGTSEADAVAS